MADELTPEDDAALAALYREAADDAEPPAAWTSLRDVIGEARASGFDEEPPARIDALLMAAARAHAPTPAAPWWRRLVMWMKPVMLHPAMAGAAALAVVGTTAGVMYRRGTGEVAQPTAPARGGRPASEPATVERPAPTPPSAGDPIATAPSTDGVDRENRNEESEAAKGKGPRPRPRPPVGDVAGGRPPEPRTDQGPGGDGDVAPSGGTVADQFNLRGGAVAQSETVVVPDDLPATPKAPLPPPPPPPPPESRTGTSGADNSADRAPPTVVAVVPEREALLRSAQQAAGRGDCVTVRAVSAKVRALDPTYHRDVFARDRDIAPCLATRTDY